MERPGTRGESRPADLAIPGETSPAGVKAGRLVWWATFLRIVGDTLAVCIPTLREAATNSYNRKVADGRARWWSARLLERVGATLEVHNPNSVAPRPGRPTIIMSNHRSHFDIPVIFQAIDGTIRMIAKKELRRVPVFGRSLSATEFIFVDRSNHEQALKALARAREHMAGGIALWIAPEGTRSRTGRLQEFKKGGFMLAIQCGAEIIPVGIDGTERVLPPTDFFHLQRGETVRVEVGEPIDASKYTPETREELMTLVRKRILELSGESTES